MAPKQDDARRGRLRVARFGEAELDHGGGPAPVARFGDPLDSDPADSDPPGGSPPDSDPPGGSPPEDHGGVVSHALLDRLGESAAGPVATLRDHPERAGPPGEAAPVAGLAAVDGEPAPAPHAATVAAVTDGESSARTRRGGGAARRGGRGGGREARPTRTRPGTGGPAEPGPDADPVAMAREICLRLLSDRARTRQELAQALRRKGVPDDAAGTVLERFDEVGLIDDAAFAGQWVRSRHNQKGLARRAIAMELRRKGVDDEVAGEALAEVDTDSEERRARELVDRKLRTVPADTPEQRKKAAGRLVGMLARKGYGGGIAYRVVREALAAHGAEIDELGSEPID